MKKRKMLLLVLFVCLLTGCGNKDVEERFSKLENEVATLKTENATLSAKLTEVTNNNETQAISTSTNYIDDSEGEPEPTTKSYVYDWGDYPDFVYNDDVVEYFVNRDRDELTVVTLDGVDIYTGDDTPTYSWKVDGITEDSYMWYFDEVESSCLLTDDAVVMLKDDGETEAFLDNVVGYGGWDCFIVVYQLNNGILTQYEQDSRCEIGKDTIASNVAEVYVYDCWLGDPLLIRKTDGQVYYFDPYDWEDDVEWNQPETMSLNRLLNGDTSVMIPIGSESLEFYRKWVEDYMEWFQTTDDPDVLYPLPALLAEFSTR